MINLREGNRKKALRRNILRRIQQKAVRHSTDGFYYDLLAELSHRRQQRIMYFHRALRLWRKGDRWISHLGLAAVYLNSDPDLAQEQITLAANDAAAIPTKKRKEYLSELNYLQHLEKYASEPAG